MKKPKQYKPKKLNVKTRTPKRKNPFKTLYDGNWNSYRKRFLHYNKNCYCCANTATVIDHIKAHKGSQELFIDTMNHLPLCKWCHDTITGKFDRKDVPLTEEKMEWIQKERKNNGINTKVVLMPYYKR